MKHFSDLTKKGTGHQMKGEFSVYQFFQNESYEKFLEFVDPETAVKGAKGLVDSVGGKLGTTQRVIITDGGDFTVFEWKHGEGVVFPKLEDLTHEKN